MSSTFSVGFFLMVGIGVFALAVIGLVALFMFGSNGDQKQDKK